MVDTKFIDIASFGLGKRKEEKKEEVVRSKVAKLFSILEEINNIWASVAEKANENDDYAWLTDHSNRPRLKRLRSEINNIKNLYPSVQTGKLLSLFDYDSTIGAEKAADPAHWYHACVGALQKFRISCYNAAIDDIKSSWVAMFARWESRLAGVPAHYGLDMSVYNDKISRIRDVRERFIGELEHARQQMQSVPENAYEILPSIERKFIQRKAEATAPAKEIRDSIMSRIKAVRYLDAIRENLKAAEGAFKKFLQENSDILNDIRPRLDKPWLQFMDSLTKTWERYYSLLGRIRQKESIDYADNMELKQLGVALDPNYLQLTQNILANVGEFNNKIHDLISRCESIAEEIRSVKEDYDEKLKNLFLEAESFRSEWNRRGISPNRLSSAGRELFDKANICIRAITHLHSGKAIVDFDAVARKKIGMENLSGNEAIDFLEKNFGPLKDSLLEEAKKARKTEEMSVQKEEDLKSKVARLLSEARKGGKFDTFVNTFVRMNKAIFPTINKNIPKKITNFYRLRPAVVEILTSISRDKPIPLPRLTEIGLGMGESYGNAVAKIEAIFNLEEFKSLLNKLADDVRAGRIESNAA